MVTIKELQEFLGVTADGIFGPKSQAALDAVLHPKPIDPEPIEIASGEKVDARSETNIATLHTKLQPIARALIAKGREAGMHFKITSGSRTYEEQAELRRKYDAGGPKAAKPGYSNHNFSLAFDITEFRGTTPIWESPNYKRMGQIGKALGLFWGGDWRGGDEDQPHFELRPSWAASMNEGPMIAELRRRKSVGQDYL